MATVLTNDTYYKNIADAIRAKNNSTAKYKPSEMSKAIEELSTGDKQVSQKDVKFYDYDGTLLYSYTLEEAQALTELPPLPIHAGLICQEWNYTLNEVTSATTPIIVGANYTTSDGKTRLYLTFYSENDISIKLALYVSGAIVIDWGDGSNTESVTESVGAGVAIPHTYTVNTYPQSVVIEIYATSGEFEIGNYGAKYGVLRGDDSTLTTKALTAVEIGENVPWINALSFAYSPRLKTISINKDCTKFSSSKLMDSPSAWGDATSNDTSCGVVAIVYPRGTSTSVYAGYVFDNCRRLECVSTPKTLANVKSIGKNALNNCFALRNIIIPDGVTSIGNGAFYNCYALASITIPNGVTSIGISAFQNCHALASITIQDGVTSIGNYAFQNCHALASITIPNGVTSIGNGAFYNCYALASITIPNGVTSISGSAFQGCYALASITIPNGVTSIRDSTFLSCYALASITIPDGVTSIGDHAFSSCLALESITIPDGVTSIGNYAFSNCKRMRYYDFCACTSVPALLSGALSTPYDCQIRVPAELYDEWIAATNWSTYASYIVAV